MFSQGVDLNTTLSPAAFHPEHFEQNAKYRLSLVVSEKIELPVLLCRGAKQGATLVVTAAVHGDEYEGVRAIYETFDELEPAAMSGNWLAVPVANPPAFWASMRTSPADGGNLARLFPGHPSGTLSQQIAYHLAHSVIAYADFFLDLHSGGVRFQMPSMVGYFASDQRAEAAAQIFGASTIWAHSTLDPGRTVSFAQACSIPWLYTEARGAGRIHPDDLSMMKAGIENLLRHLGILPGEPKPVLVQHRILGSGNTDTGVTATQAGFLLNEVEILEHVQAGQQLGRLVDLHGRHLESYYAALTGIVGLVRELPVVQSGDVLYLLAELAQ